MSLSTVIFMQIIDNNKLKENLQPIGILTLNVSGWEIKKC